MVLCCRMRDAPDRQAQVKAMTKEHLAKAYCLAYPGCLTFGTPCTMTGTYVCMATHHTLSESNK